MLLAIDIGNTTITLGIFEGEELGPRWRLRTDHQRTPDEFGIQIQGLLEHAGLSHRDLTGLVMASVVPPVTGRMEFACEQYLKRKPLTIGVGVKTGVRIMYENPRAVGADRIVDAAAVQHLYGGPACVVDFGTATTFNAVTANGDYLGGAIAPGIGIAAEALYTKTSRLTRVDLKRPPNVIGRNTTNAMQSGLVYGYVGLVEGMVARFKQELGQDMKVIATGGHASIIAEETDVLETIDQWLTLKGLRIVWELNQ